MTKINGKQMIAADYIGDFHSINPKLVASAVKVFFAKRGIQVGEDFRSQIHASHEVAKRRRRRSTSNRKHQTSNIP